MLVYLAIALTVQCIQADQQQAPAPCTFSCPTSNINDQPLLKHDSAIPYDSSFYSIFECVYGEMNANPKTQSCFYNKVDGKQALIFKTSDCHSEAISCFNNPDNHFSSSGDYRVPPWVENGRYLLYLKGNHA